MSVTVKRSIKILLPLCFIYDEKKFIEKMSEALISSFLVSDVSKSLRSLTKNERCEQIAQVAHQKWANERITGFFIANRSFAHFFAKNERFAWKTDERILSPGIVRNRTFLLGQTCYQYLRYCIVYTVLLECFENMYPYCSTTYKRYTVVK